MNTRKESTVLPLFLFDPRYRIIRHLLFILVGAVITFNQVFVAYQDCLDALGNRIYLIGLSSFVMYLVAMYFNYFYLTPRLLLKGRYILFLVILCAVVFALPTLSVAEEYEIRTALGLPHRITSYTSPLILVDNLAACMITAICFCGVSVPKVFRHWILGNEQVNRLEEEHLHSELNQLKGQVTPAFLSRILHTASGLARTDPGKASTLLMQLSQLLRYQLYDCRREKLLIQSELSFLTRFLDLEQLLNPGFRYRIHADAEIGNQFVSPLLFISLVQHAIKGSTSLDLFFTQKNGCLLFTCKSDRAEAGDDDTLPLIKKRLELQYPGAYALTVSPDVTTLKIDLSEPWKHE